MVNEQRVRALNSSSPGAGPVLYWMSRDQRIKSNNALLYAQQVAMQQKQPLLVVFNLVDDFLGATIRQYVFMLGGLQQVETELRKKQIPFLLTKGDPADNITSIIKQYKIGQVITDFSPLKINRRWKKNLLDNISVPLIEVDAHNLIPCWITSPKQEYAARTIRPKISNRFYDFLEPFQSLKKHPFPLNNIITPVNWEQTKQQLRVDRSVPEISWLKPGEKEAQKIVHTFISKKLTSYAEDRNNPALDALSNLSPYLHFGQISAQEIALKIEQSNNLENGGEVFLEELIVRRELAENYCFYNNNYDSYDGIPDWAKKTLQKHISDKRPYLYTRKQLENAATDDPLWNAAQIEMVQNGKMHGYMRMYWAKMILLWSKTPQEAFDTALYLNDKYELDGRDPNGYTGVAWSIGGVHDRPWPEREVFGTVRSMSFAGCKRKFNVDAYISRFQHSLL